MSVPVHIVEAMEAAGCTVAQVRAVLRADHDATIGRLCYDAVELALWPVGNNVVETAGPLSSFSDEKEDIVPVSAAGEDRLGRKHIARKVIGMAPGFTSQDRLVISALVDFANVNTGLCNPSRATLAKAARIGGNWPERAVYRAIRNAERSGLVTHQPGRGRGHSTVYTLHWARFAELFDQLEGRAEGPPMWAAMSRVNRDTPRVRNEDNGDANVPLTHKDSLPSSVDVESPPRERRKHFPPRTVDPLQREMLLVTDGGKAAADARHQAAVRWEMAVRGKYRGDHQRLPVLLKAAWHLDAETGELTDAELADRGGGLLAFEAHLRGPHRRSGTR